MKKIYITLLFALISVLGYSQETPTSNQDVKPTSSEDDSSIYSITGLEQRPEYPGGINEFYKYIAKNYKRPADDKLHGKVIVTFVVEKDGSLTDIKVLRDIGFGTGEEAIRILKNCAKWSPGEQNGKKVRAQYALPIQL